MKISTENVEADWKEAFFVLAVLVSGNEIAEAKKYISMALHRPTMRALDGAGLCANCSQPESNHPNRMCDAFDPPRR